MQLRLDQRLVAPFTTAHWRRLVPGLVLVFVLAVLASWMTSGLIGQFSRNPVLIAILFGLLLGNVFPVPERFRPGIDFAVRRYLRLGVMLVGFKVTTTLITQMGPIPILVAVAELCTVLAFAWWLLRKVFKFDPDFAVMLAAGNGICGAAAVLCTQSIIRGRQSQAALAVSTVTLFGTISLLAYPSLFLGGLLPGLDEDGYGVFVGSSIYEVAQVFGAAYSISDYVVNTATLVKLVKVIMLIPLAFAIGHLWYRTHEGHRTAKPPFPWFVFGFIAVMLFNSTVTLAPVFKSAIGLFDTFLFVMVMVALGLKTRLSDVLHDVHFGRLVLASSIVLLVSAGVAYAYTRAAFALIADTAQVARSTPDDAQERAFTASAHPLPGALLFESIGCAKCHVPSLPTRSGGVARLYSDLLLHDMGPALDDKIEQEQAMGSEWRTTPLSGLCLRKRFLHDGRAVTLRDAIVAHEGEGLIVRDRFLDASAVDQKNVYEFLCTL